MCTHMHACACVCACEHACVCVVSCRIGAALALAGRGGGVPSGADGGAGGPDALLPQEADLFRQGAAGGGSPALAKGEILPCAHRAQGCTG